MLVFVKLFSSVTPKTKFNVPGNAYVAFPAHVDPLDGNVLNQIKNILDQIKIN